MTIYVAVCERATPNMGRSDQNKTYVNLVRKTQVIQVSLTSLGDYLATQPPTHQWNDLNSNQYVIQLTQQEYEDIEDGTDPLTWGVVEQPKWQQDPDVSDSPRNFGSYADPELKTSTFTAATPLSDTRLTWEFYDGDPDVAGVHVAHEEFVEGVISPIGDPPVAGDFVIRHILQFNPNGARSTTNAQNQLTRINGYRFIFDFTNGVTTLEVSTVMSTVDGTGLLLIGQNRDYKLRGPAGEETYSTEVFRRRVYPS